jgi:hypothetical protein
MLKMKMTSDELKALEQKHFPVPSEFPLWGFHMENLPGGWAITRGRTAEEALEYIIHCHVFSATKIVTMETLPTSAAKLYDQNHSPGWFTRPPVWLVLKMEGIEHPVEISVAHQYPC